MTPLVAARALPIVCAAPLVAVLALACASGAGGGDDGAGTAANAGASGAASSSGGSQSVAGASAASGSGGAPLPGAGGVADSGAGGSTAGVAGKTSGGSGAGGNGGGASGKGGSGGAGAGGRGGSGGAGGSSGAGTGGGGSCSTTGGGSCPSGLTCPSGIGCGCYVLNGLGANKAAILAAGGNLDMLASAMMETELMNASYAYGDGKTNDSFNAGVSKQNWGMVRQCHPAWRGMTASQFATSAAMNSDRALDATVYKECRAFFGDDWLAGHRNGASGLQNPNTPDIQRFRAGYAWTRAQIGAAHQCDDVRFWVSIPAILVIEPE